jgi:hypothetical protein
MGFLARVLEIGNFDVVRLVVHVWKMCHLGLEISNYDSTNQTDCNETAPLNM